MILLRLELVTVILVRNAPGKSVCNTVERVMGAAYFDLSVLAMCRELATATEVETQIKRLGSAKKFVDKFQNNKEYVKA